MIIRDASIWQGGRSDVRIEGERIAAIGQLAARPGETVIDAQGAALLPGLHDHHLHLAATAAAMASLACGPPDVSTPEQLAAALSAKGAGWLRGIGYHESVAGMLTRQQIDEWQAQRPVRIQHRSGRMWFFNTLAVEALAEAGAGVAGFDPHTGRLFDNDSWLRSVLGKGPPDLAALSQSLAAYGITGVTDMSPANGPEEADWLARQFASGSLLQTCHLAGREALSEASLTAGFSLGPVKIHLHEHHLPSPDLVEGRIRAAHALGRPVAFHCTTEVELVFALATIAAAGAREGDRIEHAGIANDDHVDWIVQLGLQVVTQPNFVSERGDRYLLDVPPGEHRWLYRLEAFRRAGVVLAAGSDAPYGATDPWAAMRAAVSRQTASGIVIGHGEEQTPEQALALFLADPVTLDRQRRIAVGGLADLCLLDRPWHEARTRLHATDVRCTIARGQLVHDRVDQAPFERRSRADPAA